LNNLSSSFMSFLCLTSFNVIVAFKALSYATSLIAKDAYLLGWHNILYQFPIRVHTIYDRWLGQNKKALWVKKLTKKATLVYIPRDFEFFCLVLVFLGTNIEDNLYNIYSIFRNILLCQFRLYFEFIIWSSSLIYHTI